MLQIIRVLHHRQQVSPNTTWMNLLHNNRVMLARRLTFHLLKQLTKDLPHHLRHLPLVSGNLGLKMDPLQRKERADLAHHHQLKNVTHGRGLLNIADDLIPDHQNVNAPDLQARKRKSLVINLTHDLQKEAKNEAVVVAPRKSIRKVNTRILFTLVKLSVYVLVCMFYCI